jgi:hypothetical protein
MKNLTVEQAASIMGVRPQFLRCALQQDKFPFGVAVKQKRWVYYINPDRFFNYLGAKDGNALKQGGNHVGEKKRL